MNKHTLGVNYTACFQCKLPIYGLGPDSSLYPLPVLSPGQTDSQVVASSHKLNLRRDLRWEAKRARTFPRKYTKVEKKKPFQGRHILYFIGW